MQNKYRVVRKNAVVMSQIFTQLAINSEHQKFIQEIKFDNKAIKIDLDEPMLWLLL